MVEIDDIVDRESFEAWLVQEDMPREAMVALAHRAAMRVLPIVWWEVTGAPLTTGTNLSLLPILRPLVEMEAVSKDGNYTSVKVSSAAFISSARSQVPAVSFAINSIARAAYATVDARDFGDSELEIKTANGFVLLSGSEAAVSPCAFAVSTAGDALASAVGDAAQSTLWRVTAADCMRLLTGCRLFELALWPGEENPLDRFWYKVELFHRRSDTSQWSFWLDWYQRALDGTETRWPLLHDITLLDADDKAGLWEDPAKLATEIARLEAEYYASLNNKTELARAYPVDFTFDAMARVMRMVGIDDDMAHLRDPAVVQAFLDDCQELRDSFQDFADFADAGSGGSNRSGMLHLAAQKVLAELTRTDDEQHLRARHIVRLAQRLESFAKEKGARDELGETLGGILDESIDLLRTVTRKHFGPSYTALAPLAQLSLEQIDRDAVLELFDQVIARMEALPSNELVALDEDGLSVFRDMVRELHDFRAAIAEASTEEFRAMMESRFAESIGGTGLAFGRFLETSANAAGHVGAGTDLAIQNYNRVNSLNDIVAFIAELVERAP